MSKKITVIKFDEIKTKKGTKEKIAKEKEPTLVKVQSYARMGHTIMSEEAFQKMAADWMEQEVKRKAALSAAKLTNILL